jgi:kynurenine formamidase
MHYDLFPLNIIHAENVGGDIDKVLGKRLIIGCFPWRFEGGESCIARIVAFDAE